MKSSQPLSPACSPHLQQDASLTRREKEAAKEHKIIDRNATLVSQKEFAIMQKTDEVCLLRVLVCCRDEGGSHQKSDEACGQNLSESIMSR